MTLRTNETEELATYHQCDSGKQHAWNEEWMGRRLGFAFVEQRH